MFGSLVGIHYFCRVFSENLRYEVDQLSAFIRSCGGSDDGVTGICAVASLYGYS